MKRTVGIIFLILPVLLVLFASSCSLEEQNGADGKICIVCTAFPQYDWVTSIVGEKSDGFDVTLLTDNGVDMHSYQPTVDDIVNISKSDLVIYVGGESENWLKDAFENSVKQEVNRLCLMDILGEDVLQVTHSDDEQPSDTHDLHGADEHVWLSLKNAVRFCEAICAEISKLDPENAEYYQKNTQDYTEKIAALDEKMTTGLLDVQHDTLIFAGRFPFRYFLNDYGIRHFAAFEGCSADSEVSFETIAFLADKLDELKIDCILTSDDADSKLADTIIANTSSGECRVMQVNSLQSVTQKDMEQDLNYISVMSDNVNTFLEALG